MSTTQRNPFTPVPGKVPPYLAGRSEVLAEMQEVFSDGENSPSLISLLVGARGTGKTALLCAFADMAEERGWVTARVTAAPGMLEEIIMRINRSADHLIEKPSGRRIKKLQVARIGSVELEGKEKPPTNWRVDIDNLLDQLDETDTGLFVTVDEVDSDLDEMSTLVTVFQHLLDEGRKVALSMAGLPYGLNALASGKSTSFLRRAARHELGPISDYDIEEAFRITLEKGGKSIGNNALDDAVRAIGGFPYMLQLVGYRAWNLAAERSEVTADDIAAASRIAQRELEERIYEATLFDLSEADRAFLRAMLEDESFTRQADLPTRLDKTSGHVSKYKKRLMSQGIIKERARGTLEFCLPGFRSYFAEQDALLSQ